MHSVRVSLNFQLLNPTVDSTDFNALKFCWFNKSSTEMSYSPYWQLLLNGNYRGILPLLPSPRWPYGSAKCARVAGPLATLSSGPQYSCTSQTWRASLASAPPPQLPDRNSWFPHEITKFCRRPSPFQPCASIASVLFFWAIFWFAPVPYFDPNLLAVDLTLPLQCGWRVCKKILNKFKIVRICTEDCSTGQQLIAVVC